MSPRPVAAAVRRPKELPPLNASTTRVLCVLVEGGKIEARRTFPHEHRYTLLKKDGHSYAAGVTRECIADLLANDCRDAIIRDHPVCDEIDYHATSQGHEAVAARGPLPKDDAGQIDLLDLLGESAA